MEIALEDPRVCFIRKTGDTGFPTIKTKSNTCMQIKISIAG